MHKAVNKVSLTLIQKEYVYYKISRIFIFAQIKDVIRQGVEVPESQNDLRRMQLRELALLNGTLRESDAPKCSNCGSTAHRSWQCPDKPNVTNNVVCTNCNGVGHISRDCKEKKTNPSVPVNQSKIDEEYMSLMAELGEGPPPPKTTTSTTFAGAVSGPTIGLMSSVPKPLGPPPPPPPIPQASMNSGHQQHTPLLPTPSMPPQQHVGWGRDVSQPPPPPPPQSGWSNHQNSYGLPNSTAYPMTDSYSNNMYSQPSTPQMPWSSTGT